LQLDYILVSKFIWKRVLLTDTNDLFWLSRNRRNLHVFRASSSVQYDMCTAWSLMLAIYWNEFKNFPNSLVNHIFKLHLHCFNKQFYKAALILFSLKISLIKIWPYLHFFVRPYSDSFYYWWWNASVSFQKILFPEWNNDDIVRLNFILIMVNLCDFIVLKFLKIALEYVNNYIYRHFKTRSCCVPLD